LLILDGSASKFSKAAKQSAEEDSDSRRAALNRIRNTLRHGANPALLG
jgi:hypothetical protein